MQEFVLTHVSGRRHAQLPPSPEQCWPTIGQSVSMQHVPVGMQMWRTGTRAGWSGTRTFPPAIDKADR